MKLIDIFETISRAAVMVLIIAVVVVFVKTQSGRNDYNERRLQQIRRRLANELEYAQNIKRGAELYNLPANTCSTRTAPYSTATSDSIDPRTPEEIREDALSERTPDE